MSQLHIKFVLCICIYGLKKTIYMFTTHIYTKPIYIYRYSSKSLYVVQSLYFGSLLPKYRDCTTYNDFELYLMCCGVMLLLLIMHRYLHINTVYTYYILHKVAKMTHSSNVEEKNN